MSSQRDTEKLREQMLADPKFMRELREGVKAVQEGRTIPWTDVKRELGLTDEEED